MRERVLADARTALANQDDRQLVATAVRQSLDWFAKVHPGRSVEVRVPPWRVVQIIAGATHRRGTPPAVVEMSPQVWLQLVVGEMTWNQARRDGLIHASGERSDLSSLLPI